MTKGQRYGIMSIAKSKGDHLIMNEELQKAAVPEKIQKKDLRIQEDRQDERRSHLVVKDNLLIQKSKFHLTATEQKLVCYVISLIKPTDKALDKYTININDFAKLCGISPKNVYKEFRKMIDDLDNKAVWLTMGDKTFKFRWFSEAEYIEKQGKVILMLNSNMKQYLIDLSHSFTQYELYNILALKSKYSIRLYELFKSYSYKQTKDFDLEHINPKGQKVKTEKIDFIDCFLVFDEEDGVQEVYSTTFNNKSSLSENDFYKSITAQCDADELFDLRYEEFN